MVFKAIVVLLCILPFGYFFFKPADLWHGQGHFFQSALLVIFCLSFLEKSRHNQVLNKPLGLFTLWAGLLTCYLWHKAFLATNQYAVKIFLPFFNWLCFLIFYKLSIEYLDREKIEKILCWIRYSVIAVLFYCVLQHFKLDEFLAGTSGHDELVGTLGNSSHLAGYLAIIQPIFFNRKGTIPLILLWLIIFLTGSASGIAVGVAAIIFWLFLKKQYFFARISCVIAGIATLLTINYLPSFFTSSGRIEVWKLAFENFKTKAITGYGMGSFALMKYNTSSSHWRHAHNEYYQIAFELGIIGLLLLLWCIWEYFRIFKTFRTDLTDRLAVMFSGFCLLGLFTFNAHLWQIAAIGMMSYSFLFTLKNEVAQCQ